MEKNKIGNNMNLSIKNKIGKLIERELFNAKSDIQVLNSGIKAGLTIDKTFEKVLQSCKDNKKLLKECLIWISKQ